MRGTLRGVLKATLRLSVFYEESLAQTPGLIQSHREKGMVESKAHAHLYVWILLSKLPLHEINNMGFLQIGSSTPKPSFSSSSS